MLCVQFIFKLYVLFFFSLILATSVRSSHCSLKKVFLKFLQNLQKNMCWSRIETLLRKRIQHWYFPVIFTKFSYKFSFYRNIQATTLLLSLESPIFCGFLFSNLPDVYLWSFSNNNHTNSFDSHKVCTLCLLIE